MRRREAGEVETEAPRFGLTATRKIGGAVERNRMKRRLRAALRDLGAEGGFGQSGHDYVVVLRAEALSTRFEALLAELRQAMRKAHRPRPGTGATVQSDPPPAGQTS